MEGNEAKKMKFAVEEAVFPEVEFLKKRKLRYFARYAPCIDEEEKLQEMLKKREACRSFKGIITDDWLRSKRISCLKQSVKQIKKLNLELRLYNVIDGNREYKKLREVIKRSRCLQTVDIKMKSIPTKYHLSNLSQSFKGLCTLQNFAFDINFYRILDEELKILGQYFKGIHSLKNIKFKCNEDLACVKGLQALCKRFKRLSFLEDVSLFFDQFHRKVFKGLGQSLKGMNSQANVNLCFLNLRLNNKDVEMMKLALKECSFIPNLGLDFTKGHNRLSDQGLQALSEYFHTLKLKNLMVNLSSEIPRETRETFMKNLGDSSHLESLKLIFSDFVVVHEEEIAFLSQSLSKLHSLKDLHLGFSRCKDISDEGLKTLRQTFEKLTQLKNISIDLPSSHKGVHALKDGLKNIKHEI